MVVPPKPGGIHHAKKKVYLSRLIKEDISGMVRHRHWGTMTAEELQQQSNEDVATAKSNPATKKDYGKEKRTLDHYRGNNKQVSKAVAKWKELDEAGQDYQDPAQNFSSNISASRMAKLLGLRDVNQLQSSDWVYARLMGEGGFGFVHLFVKQDANRNTLERMIVKIATVQGPANAREYYVHKRVELGDWSEGTTQVPKLIGSTYQVRTPEYVIIRQEYAPHGDLWRLISWYYGLRRIVPEPFIWHVFWSLVKACCVMQYGCDNPTNRDPARTKEWIEEAGFIAHLDQKFDNIFLANRETPQTNPINRFPWTDHYPRVVLGDWRLSKEFIPNDPGNPADASTTTKGMMAPEQRIQDNNIPPTGIFPNGVRQLTTQADRLITSRTNLWGVANLIYHLMRPDMLGVERNNHHEPFLMEHELYGNGLLTARYSSELTDLVFACLRFPQSDRPGLDDVHSRVEQAMQRLNQTDWSRTPPPHLVHPVDHWPIGWRVFNKPDYDIPIDNATIIPHKKRKRQSEDSLPRKKQKKR